MKTSARTIAIIQCLLEGGDTITAGTIARELGVSSKTISRELPKVEMMLKAYGLELVRKTGTGLRIAGDAAQFEELRQSARQTKLAAYTPQQRQIILAGQLLRTTEPIKLFTLANMLRVTDGTVSHDLDKLEAWFKERQLLLVRRPGLGAYVKGSEQDIRRALVSIIYANLDEEKLLCLVHDQREGKRGRENAADQYLLNLVDEQIVHELEIMVHEMEGGLPHPLSDTAFIGLVVHLSLAVQRMRKQEDIHIDAVTLSDLRSRREYQVATELARHMALRFAITVPEDEIGYITMHLLGARSLYRTDNDRMTSVVDNFHLVRMARSIMKRAEQETGSKLLSNKDLLLGLVNHLGPSISRLSMHMDIRNPLLKEMSTTYPQYMELARKSVGPLEQELGEKLPDAEIAYIAMHLGAALTERRPVVPQRLRVIVACQTGMGTSRMLASGLKQSYDELEIVDLVSALQINAEYIRHHDADFVISTVPIPWSPLPVVVTTPLLDEADKRRIDEELLHQQKRAVRLREALPPKQTVPFPEALRQMAAYTKAIQELLHNFFSRDLDEPALNIRDICKAAAGAASKNAERQAGIAAALLAREAEGETILRGNAMILLHARTSCASSLLFGILHLRKPVQYPLEDGELIRTAIVMLGPENSSREALETIGAVSAALLDRWGLIEILNEGNPHDIYQELETIFKDFYQKKYSELLGNHNA